MRVQLSLSLYLSLSLSLGVELRPLRLVLSSEAGASVHARAGGAAATSSSQRPEPRRAPPEKESLESIVPRSRNQERLHKMKPGGVNSAVRNGMDRCAFRCALLVLLALVLLTCLSHFVCSAPSRLCTSMRLHADA
jgi:hypothetical protein